MNLLIVPARENGNDEMRWLKQERRGYKPRLAKCLSPSPDGEGGVRRIKIKEICLI